MPQLLILVPVADMNSQSLWQTRIINHHAREGQDRNKREEKAERDTEKTREKLGEDQKEEAESNKQGQETRKQCWTARQEWRAG